MKFSCPSCKSSYENTEAEFGRKIRCACGYSFVLTEQCLGSGESLEDTLSLERDSSGALGTVGEYRLEKSLGKGAAGSVYLARHIHLDNQVAVKILNMKASDNPDSSRRFIREARLAAQMVHPNVVRVLDCGTFRGNLYYVMECVSRGSLGDLLKKEKRLSEEVVVKVGIAVCRALECAGGFDIVHRDIKPDNIMVDSHGRYKVADLGLARGASNEQGTQGAGLTSIRTGMGTPHFMPPEQAIDAHSADCRSDIYSLGVSMFQLITGRLPFAGDSSRQVIYRHMHDQPPVPQELNPAIGEGLSNMILRCMMKNPEDRFQSPLDLRQHLEEYLLDGKSHIAGEAVYKEYRDPSKQKYILILIALGLLIVLLVTFIFV